MKVKSMIPRGFLGQSKFSLSFPVQGKRYRRKEQAGERQIVIGRYLSFIAAGKAEPPNRAEDDMLLENVVSLESGLEATVRGTKQVECGS